VGIKGEESINLVQEFKVQGVERVQVVQGFKVQGSKG
jgi:hypothetical protein